MAHSGRPRKCDPRVDNLRSNISNNEFETAKRTLGEFGIDCTDGEGRTALINATIEGKQDFIIWLIENGADVNHQDRIGYAALHFAAQDVSFPLTELLLKNGANPNLQDIHGNIPLWTAMFNSKRSISSTTKLLLKYKSDYNLLNNYDKTPKIMFQTFFNGDISKVDLSDL